MYEKIMSDVSKIVKRNLLEAEEAKTEVEVAADKLISDFKKFNKDLETGIELMKIVSKGHEKEVNTVSWHPVHEEIFCSAGVDSSIIYWKVGQVKNFVVKNAHDKEIFDLCFNNTGTILASGSNDGFLKFWKRKNFQRKDGV